MIHYCYMVKCANGALYTGWSLDPLAREGVHNRGYGARYTRTHRPVKLVYVEALESLSAALIREREIKRLPAKKKWALIDTEANILAKLIFECLEDELKKED